MKSFLVDASALVKRYVPELGSALVNHLFTQTQRQRLMCLMLGAAEVAAALVRKRNGGLLSQSLFAGAMTLFSAEVLGASDFLKLPCENPTIDASLPFLEKHALNATDAVLLQAALDRAALLRSAGDDLVLITSDQRLLKAAQAEGLLTFNPETQTQADLDTLLAP